MTKFSHTSPPVLERRTVYSLSNASNRYENPSCCVSPNLIIVIARYRLHQRAPFSTLLITNHHSESLREAAIFFAGSFLGRYTAAERASANHNCERAFSGNTVISKVCKLILGGPIIESAFVS
jgi:hypothetical protein